jgi:hypothetical protein
MRPIITLTTDFGTRDSYVGEMKGVLLSLCPDAHLVDITNEIAPQDIQAAALVVHSMAAAFPPHTVHLVVVDPGVGSARHPMACATPQGRFVGPDNGVLSLVWQQAHDQNPADAHAVVLAEPRFWRPTISTTFHGRDIFAPVAAHLAAGTSLDELGPPLAAPVLLPLPAPTWEGPARLCGEVVMVDHFGNCISNITEAHLTRLGPAPALVVLAGEHRLALHHTYAGVAPGEPLALVGSSGRMELSVRNGSAGHALHIAPGFPLCVERRSAE